MDTFKYNCAYCHEEFIPKRRYAQKYCSNSCRAKAYHRRQVEKGGAKKISKEKKDVLPQFVQPNNIPIEKKNAIEKMSSAGVGNVVAGTLIAEFIKNLLTGDDSKPATKKDIATLINKLDRYHLITNLPPRNFNKFPYFDLHTNQVVYF
ncbi:hypothetical protein [Litoribaculum gwangyangense]|uniref:Uncharacterized protein n=1 Tax=Litoribaculum gwangyangense TaxID=1130722 RepID=A0ABP9CLG1_9FLAO